jgi:chromosome segregation ATPase
LGSAQYSPTTSQSAHNSHLQDLQHQISTKTLALQTLQREHDQLLAAFSRSQIRCAALDKKSQVSDHEINTLSEDKIRLQQQVESLEAQVQGLIKARHEIVQQSTADGTQWRQIMAMSSQLQIKGAEDAKRFKAERDAWDEERAALQKRVEELESSKTILPKAHRVSDPPTPSILGSESVEVLRQEVVRLRQRCSDLELKLQTLAGEAEQIENAISAMENLRRTLAGSKRSADET